MAYKFQLGAARLSGSLVQEGNITAESSQVTASLVTASAIHVPDSGLYLNGTAVTATAAEINKLDGVIADTTQLNFLANADLVSGDFQKLADITVTAAEINHLGGVTSGVQSQLDAKLAIASNLSDLADAATARTNLGVEIGADVQAWDADLDAIAALAKTDGNFIVADGSGWVVESGATARTSLGLGTIATQNSGNVNIIGGIIDGTWIGKNAQHTGSFSVVSSSADISASADVYAGGGLYGASISLSDASGIVAANGGLDQTGGELHLAAAVAGNGIDLTSGVLSVDFATDGALAFIGASNDELSLKIKDSSLVKDANGVQVKLKTEAGGTISVDASGLYIANSAISNDKLANSTISGVSLGDNLFSLDDAGANSGLTMTAYNGSAAVSDLAINLASSNALVLTNGLDLKGTIAGPRTFSDDMTINASASISGDLTVAGDLEVQGALTYIDTTNLKVTDQLITIADGQGSFATGAGFELGTLGSTWAYFKTAQADIDGVSGNENIFDSSLPIKAPSMAATTFYGQLVGSFQESVKSWTAGGNLEVGVNKVTSQSTALSFNLPASPSEGDVVRFKANAATDSTKTCTIIAPGAGLNATIDGPSKQIVLESPHAAVSLIYIATGNEWMVF